MKQTDDKRVENNEVIDGLESLSHTHANKALLDTYTQTEANLADAVSKKHSQNTDTGTTSQTFQLQSGSSGAKLKNNSGAVEARNSADGAYANIQGAQIKGSTGLFGGDTNYSEFEADGTLKFNGDATVWDDMRVVPGSFDRPGISDPDIVAYDVNGGGVSTYLWEFAKNDIASFTVQLPHGYKAGSNIYAHIHWTPGARGAAENGATVGWKIDYSWANIDGAFGTMATLDLSDACDGTDHKHQMTPEVSITGTSKTMSSMLLCNIKRTDTGTDDTWASTTSGQLPMLLEIDFHFQMDTVGSRTQSAK